MHALTLHVLSERTHVTNLYNVINDSTASHHTRTLTNCNSCSAAVHMSPATATHASSPPPPAVVAHHHRALALAAAAAAAATCAASATCAHGACGALRGSRMSWVL